MVVGLHLIVSAASRLPAVLNILNLFYDEEFYWEDIPEWCICFWLGKMYFPYSPQILLNKNFMKPFHQ